MFGLCARQFKRDCENPHVRLHVTNSDCMYDWSFHSNRLPDAVTWLAYLPHWWKSLWRCLPSISWMPSTIPRIKYYLDCSRASSKKCWVTGPTYLIYVERVVFYTRWRADTRMPFTMLCSKPYVPFFSISELSLITPD
jgi:hypothetical protein